MTPGYTLAVRQRGDNYVAKLTLRMGRDLCMSLKARVSQSAIARLLNKTFRGRIRMSGQEPDVMGFFGKIARAVKNVASKVARSKVFRTANKLMRNPLVQSMAQSIPGVGSTMAALRTANMGLQAARGIAKTFRRAGPGAMLAPVMSQFNLAKQAAGALKRQAFGMAQQYNLPQVQFQAAWRSGFTSQPDPRQVAAIRAYQGPQNVQQMYRQYLPQAQRGYQRQMPQFMMQYGGRAA